MRRHKVHIDLPLPMLSLTYDSGESTMSCSLITTVRYYLHCRNPEHPQRYPPPPTSDRIRSQVPFQTPLYFKTVLRLVDRENYSRGPWDLLPSRRRFAVQLSNVFSNVVESCRMCFLCLPVSY